MRSPHKAADGICSVYQKYINAYLFTKQSSKTHSAQCPRELKWGCYLGAEIMKLVILVILLLTPLTRYLHLSQCIQTTNMKMLGKIMCSEYGYTLQ